MSANLLNLNTSMTEFLVIGLKQQLSKIDNSSLNTIHSARNCGFIFDENLTFSDQSSSLSTSCDSPSLPPLSTLNLTTVTMYYNLPKSQINRLQQIQNCLHVLWLKLINLLISHLSSDLCNGSRLMNALNINSYHSPTKFLQPANLTTYTISLQVELAPHLVSP